MSMAIAQVFWTLSQRLKEQDATAFGISLWHDCPAG